MLLLLLLVLHLCCMESVIPLLLLLLLVMVVVRVRTAAVPALQCSTAPPAAPCCRLPWLLLVLGQKSRQHLLVLHLNAPRTPATTTGRFCS